MTYKDVLENYNTEKVPYEFKYLVKDKQTGTPIGYILGMEVLNNNSPSAEAKIYPY